jgi:long-chain acyl-CoA synthetase
MSTFTYPDVPLHEILRAQARCRPGSVAIVHEGKTLTFADLEAASNRLANGLAQLGLEPAGRLGLFLPNCPEFQIGFYAASKLGAAACPMNSAYREREIVYQLNDNGAAILLTHTKLMPVVQAALPQLTCIRSVVVVGAAGSNAGAAGGSTAAAAGSDAGAKILHLEEVVAGQSADPPSVQVDPDRLAALPYSSGTTGFPKGVMLTHRNLVANHHQYVRAIGLGPGDAYVVYMPLSHIYGVAMMGSGILSAAKQILLERFDLETVIRLIQEHSVTWLFAVPPVLLALANAEELGPSQFRTIKYIFSAAAPLPPDVARRVQERVGAPLVQGYGLTEASPATHNSPLEPGRIKLESGGVLVAGTEHRIVDLETGEITLGPSEVGEIVVRGPQVMRGYWNAPEETARVLRDGWLYTGDIGWVDDDGYLYIVDRKKEMIKYKSFSVAPAELEAVLLEHPGVADCAVLGVPDPESGEVPKAFVVPYPGQAIDVDELARFVSERVAGYKQIRHFEVIDSIPKSPSGKILRRLLKN